MWLRNSQRCEGGWEVESWVNCGGGGWRRGGGTRVGDDGREIVSLGSLKGGRKRRTGRNLPCREKYEGLVVRGTLGLGQASTSY